MRRAGSVALLATLTAALTALVGLTPSSAQDAGEAGTPEIFGTLEDPDDEPLVGVVLRVTSADESFDQTVESDDEGNWRVAVPRPGSYSVEIDPETLPEGVALRNPRNNPTTVSIRPGQGRRILFPFGERATAGINLYPVLQALLSGVKIGLIIAITSVGLSLVFGTTGLINFAHGEFVTLGALTAWFLNVRGPGLHLVWAAILATVIGAAFVGGLDRGLFRWLRARRVGGFQFLVITIGLSLLLRHAFLLWYGGRLAPFAQYGVQTSMTWGPFRITPRDLTVMALSLLVLVAFGLMLQRTRVGKAIRAVADNPDLAESSGIDVERVVLVVWVLGGALAAFGGVMLGLIATVEWQMGFRLLLLMFAGVILGGLGTAYGAMVGGLVVGIVAEVSTVWMNAELKNVWALVVLVVVLLVRPQGILGVRERLG